MRQPDRGSEMKDRICELECNIDDMTAEEIAFAAESLMKAGAKDAVITPIVMKKGRPAWMLTVMCSDDDGEKERFAELMFRLTSTIGIREVISERFILDTLFCFLCSCLQIYSINIQLPNNNCLKLL